jgi:hypothetical protein
MSPTLTAASYTPGGGNLQGDNAQAVTTLEQVIVAAELTSRPPTCSNWSRC